MDGVGVVLGAIVEVGGSGLGVRDGVRVGVDDGGMVEVIAGWEVSVAVGAGWMNGFEKLPQETTIKRMNIIVK
jgi:hypothetical protein